LVLLLLLLDGQQQRRQESFQIYDLIDPYTATASQGYLLEVAGSHQPALYYLHHHDDDDDET